MNVFISLHNEKHGADLTYLTSTSTTVLCLNKGVFVMNVHSLPQSVGIPKLGRLPPLETTYTK